MAANDYHVIMYQILLYLYDCLKKGIDPDNEAVEAYRKLHEINIRYWQKVMKDMEKDGYLENIREPWWQNIEITTDTVITRKGVEYLFDYAEKGAKHED